MQSYFTYFMSSLGGMLYTGVTNNIMNRVFTHKQRIISGFTKRYDITRLVYYEESADIWNAIAREREIKGWKRYKKIALIESQNPKWKDLAADWFSDEDFFEGNP